MAKVLVIFATIGVVFVAGSRIPSKSAVERKVGPVIDEETAAVLEANPLISYIGQFENKKYYTDNLDKNYAEANSFCTNLGFDLAAVGSTEEASFIYRNTRSSYFWTSGRGQVVWETDNTAVTLPIIGANANDFRLRYDLRSSSSVRYLVASSVYELGFPLCQIVTAPQ